MCPLCSPIVLLILFIVPQIFILCTAAASWTAKFNPNETRMEMDTYQEINVELFNLNTELIDNSEVHIRTDSEHLLRVDKTFEITNLPDKGPWTGNFTLNALFLGNANVYVEIKKKDTNISERSDQVLPVTIIRPDAIINAIFTGSVATLVSILYINFGAALNLEKLKGIGKRPIGPLIGFFCQFLAMPLVSSINILFVII